MSGSDQIIFAATTGSSGAGGSNAGTITALTNGGSIVGDATIAGDDGVAALSPAIYAAPSFANAIIVLWATPETLAPVGGHPQVAAYAASSERAPQVDTRYYFTLDSATGAGDLTETLICDDVYNAFRPGSFELFAEGGVNPIETATFTQYGGSWLAPLDPIDLQNGTYYVELTGALDTSHGSVYPVVSFTAIATGSAAPSVADVADPGNAAYDAGFAVTAGASVTVTIDGAALTSAQIASDFVLSSSGGLDTYTAAPGAFAGTETIVVSATTSDGGQTSAPTMLTLAPIDTTPPAQPSIASAVAVGSGGSWALGGAAEAGTTVTIYDGATALGTTVASAEGAWAFTAGGGTMASRDFSVTATDAAGNVSARSAAWSGGGPDMTTWDVTSQFSGNSNPNGAWSYGWEATLNGPLNLYDAGTGIDWYASNHHSGDYTPAIWLNTTGATAYGVSPGQVSLHPGWDGSFSVARWTSPITGTVAVSGFFGSGDGGWESYYISTNEGTVYAWPTDPNTENFSFSLDVTSGETLDFIVGTPVGGGYGYGNTPLSVTITPLQPPSPPNVHDVADPGNAAYEAGFSVTAGATVTVTVDGSALTAAEIASDFVLSSGGGWDAYTAAPGAFAGTETVIVSATMSDAGGDVSAPTMLTLAPIDTTPPAQPSIASASAVGPGGSWSLAGAAEAGTTVTIYDGATALGATLASAAGAWTFTTGAAMAIRDFTATATDAAGNVSAASAGWYEAAPGNAFSFDSEQALSAAALITGAGGSGVLDIISGANLTDGDFAHMRSIQTLGLPGASSVALGPNASAAGIRTVDLLAGAAGTTSIADGNAGSLAVDAAGLSAGDTLALSGSASEIVSNLAGNVDATGLTGSLMVLSTGTGSLSIATGSAPAMVDSKLAAGQTLTLTGAGPVAVNGLAGDLNAAGETGSLSATTTGSAPQTVTIGTGSTAITDHTTGLLTVEANVAAGKTLILMGGAATVNGLIGNLSAMGDSGALTVATTGSAAQSIVTGSGSMAIADGSSGKLSVTASAMAAGHTLTLTGSGPASLMLQADLAASGDSGALTVMATGSAAQTIRTGAGKDSISATQGGDTIAGGGGGDMIIVNGHGAADAFAYAAASDSLNTAGGHDTIAGFLASGAVHDLMDFSPLDPNLSLQGALSGNTVDAGSIGWLYQGGGAMVYVNDTGDALATSSANLMEITLFGVTSGLSGGNFRV